MADSQTLFSFELFVENIRLDAVKVDKVNPAVGVRLLDFPTLLLYPSQNRDSCSKPQPGPFLESGRKSFCFNKGKSCLFKISLDSLHNHLCSAPLYTMLLDVNTDIPKLVGSSLISLANLTGSIKQAVEKHGICTPAACGEKFSSHIFNIIGENIGTISLSCKVVSLGSSLIPHMMSENGTCGNPSPSPPPGPKPDSTKCAQPVEPVNSRMNEILLCAAVIAPETKTLRATQINILGKKRTTSLDAEVKSDELCGMFCPPPLFYTSTQASREQHVSYRMEDLEEHLRMVDPSVEDTSNGDQPCTPQKPRRTEDGLPSSLSQQQSPTVPSVLTDAIRQLPLLNALFAELLHLGGQMQQPLAGHPVNYRAAQESSSVPALDKPQAENLKIAVPARLKCNPKGCISPCISPAFGKKQHERSQPQHKLRYGLTHSFHLRLKQIKPGTMRHRECTEELKMRKRSSKPGYSEMVHTDSKASGETLLSRTTFIKQAKSPAAKDVPDKANKEVQVHIPSLLGHNTDHKAYESVSSSQPHVIQTSFDLRSSIQSNGKSYSPSHSSVSNHDCPQPDDYQDDFTSLDPTDGSLLSSPEPYRPPRAQVSSGSLSSGNSSQRNKAHPVPVRTQSSPKRSLRAAHAISFACGTSSEDSKTGFSRTSLQRDSESYSGSLKSPTVSRILRTPVGEPFDDSVLESTESEEQKDELGSLVFQNKYQSISELVVNKLPGYTL